MRAVLDPKLRIRTTADTGRRIRAVIDSGRRIGTTDDTRRRIKMVFILMAFIRSDVTN